MILKHFIPLGFIVMIICMSCSSASSEPAVWGDDMSYSYLFKGDADTKAVMAVVTRTLGSRQKAQPSDKIGNLGFVEVSTFPHPGTLDVDATSQYVAVILGKKPRLVTLPDKALFVHFAKNIRPNPDMLEAWWRIKTAVLLATGSGRIADKPEPTWSDENGILVIHYHRYVDSDNMGQTMRQPPPRLEECTLTVDANQDFMLECVDRGYK